MEEDAEMSVGNFNYKHQHRVEGIINKYQQKKFVEKSFSIAFLLRLAKNCSEPETREISDCFHMLFTEK